jgi:hypothetical protein
VQEPIGRYPGMLLNHVEMLYRSGERELAAEFFRTLGCSVETKLHDVYGFAFVNGTDRDVINNVIYFSEVRSEQVALEQALESAVASDAALAGSLEAYREKRRTRPHGIPHFGIRYPSFAELEAVIARLESLEGGLRGRVEGPVVLRPGDEQSMTKDLIQAFVATDVVFSGLATIGQAIELQAQEIRS